LLALVVRSADACRSLPGTADRVELVDEDDRGRGLLRLGEEVTHAGGADADDRLYELRGGDREERGVRLAGDGAGRQGLAGAGRAEQQDAVRYASPEAGVAVGRLQKVDDLGQLGPGPVAPRDAAAGHLGRGRVDPTRLRAPEVAEAAEPSTTALRAAEDEPEEGHEEYRRREPEQQLREQRAAGVRVLGVDLDAFRLQLIRQRGVVPERRNLGR